VLFIEEHQQSEMDQLDKMAELFNEACSMKFKLQEQKKPLIRNTIFPQ
jgi:hypothetical protein